MRLIRDHGQLRLWCGVGLGIGLAATTLWLIDWNYELGGALSRGFAFVMIASATGWLGWRIGIVLPDLADPGLRIERWRRVRTSVVRIGVAMIRRQALIISLFAAIGFAGMNVLLDSNRGWIEGESSAIRTAINRWMLNGTGATIGGWLGFVIDRLSSDDRDAR